EVFRGDLAYLGNYVLVQGSAYYALQEKDFSVGRQSLADKRREMIPALRDLYLETYTLE
ncbi:MAG: hypothetical protein GY731_16870, partial [Gammaproteobacteria bacterium]|nr:hypothetical protein [Gammaproteobacteria bacterium]